MSSSGEGAQICYLLILLISIGFLVWGLIELLKQPTKNEMTTDKNPEGKSVKNGGKLDDGGQTRDGKNVTAAVISRQIKGFALIMLAHIVFVLGVAICTGLAGGVSGAARKIMG